MSESARTCHLDRLWPAGVENWQKPALAVIVCLDSLAERDYWAVVAYLLVRNGVIQENVPVGPETAEKILIKR